jgi:hypothetical protein
MVVARVLPEFLDAAVVPPVGTAFVLRSSAFEIPLAWEQGEWVHREGMNPSVIEGDASDVLLYALGRVPLKKANVSVTRPDIARNFKRYLSGP